MPHQTHSRSFFFYINTYFWLIIGSVLAAIGVKIFLAPNHLIDGGVVGIAMIGSYLVGPKYLPLFYLLLNIPFLFLAFKQIGKHFVFMMFIAVILFGVS
ncbi:MAG: YitT family protein, partial [Chlamydiota bacterium]